MSNSNRTWTYRITNVSAQDLSHWGLEFECIDDFEIVDFQPADATVETEENESCDIAGDPACGPYDGIKFNYTVAEGESVNFSFTLNEQVAIGNT